MDHLVDTAGDLPIGLVVVGDEEGGLHPLFVVQLDTDDLQLLSKLLLELLQLGDLRLAGGTPACEEHNEGELLCGAVDLDPVGRGALDGSGLVGLFQSEDCGGGGRGALSLGTSITEGALG